MFNNVQGVTAIVIDSMERYYFVRRLVSSVKMEFDFLFLTSEPVAHMRLILVGFRSIYLHRPFLLKFKQNKLVAKTEYESAIEVLNGHVTHKRAWLDANAIYFNVSKGFRKFSVSQCIIWNGQQLLGRVISKICEWHGIQKKFLEISNLPNKLFMDKLGVNALSTISIDPTVLDALPMPNEEKHQSWLMSYEQYKAKPLPQSQIFVGRRIVSGFNYGVKFVTRGVARTSLRTVRVKNSSVVQRQVKNVLIEDFYVKPYIFLPLQVSGDTQIKLHSDVDNVKVIEIASGMALKEGVRLLVKLHPAENDTKVILEIFRLQKNYSFDIVMGNTTELIKYAKKIITINSTVGLEALLYGKEVISLGRCFYKQFDRPRLLKYIHSFLIDDIDYFGLGEISIAAARNIFNLKLH